MAMGKVSVMVMAGVTSVIVMLRIRVRVEGAEKG